MRARANDSADVTRARDATRDARRAHGGGRDGRHVPRRRGTTAAAGSSGTDGRAFSTRASDARTTERTDERTSGRTSARRERTRARTCAGSRAARGLDKPTPSPAVES